MRPPGYGADGTLQGGSTPFAHSPNPMDSLEAAKRLVAAIVYVAGGEFVGKTKLVKAYYAAHLFHHDREDGLLSKRHRVVHMTHGPAIDDQNEIFRQLRREGILEYSEGVAALYPVRYRLREGYDPGLSDAERRSLEAAVAWVRGLSATDLSEQTHLSSRSWQETREGDFQDIYLDLIEEAEEARIAKAQAEHESFVRGIFE